MSAVAIGDVWLPALLAKTHEEAVKEGRGCVCVCFQDGTWSEVSHAIMLESHAKFVVGKQPHGAHVVP